MTLRLKVEINNGSNMTTFDHRDIRIIIDAMSEYRYGIVDLKEEEEEEDGSESKREEYIKTIEMIDRIRKDLRVIGDEWNPAGKYN